MTAHTNPEQLSKYLTKALPPSDVVALLTHVEICQPCREALAEARLAGMTWTAVPLLCATGEEPHLTEEEMVAFVARRMPQTQRAAATAHVAACEICRDSVAAMETERDSVRGLPRRPRVPWFPLAGAIAAGLLLAAAIHFWRGQPSRIPAQVATAAPLASLHDASGTIELEANGTLRGLADISPAERDLVRDTMKQRSLPAGPVMPVEAPGVLLSPDTTPSRAQFALTGPIGIRVLSDRPVFSWQPSPGASAYQVVVTSEKLDPLARSGRIKDTQWQPEMPLPRGVVLLWQVRAWHGDDMVSAPAPPAPPARFEIAGEQIAARLQQLRQSPQPSHLLAAVLAAREGLRQEAAQELQILARENPNSPLIQSLQSTLAPH